MYDSLIRHVRRDHDVQDFDPDCGDCQALIIDSGVWEPRSFAMGDRVRVRVSDECVWTADDDAGYPRHWPDENGCTGTITDDSMNGTHRYEVTFDCPIMAGNYGFYAAIELTPLDAKASRP